MRDTRCLADTDGRWQIGWRLNWSFACPTHRRLLADWCPVCGRPQRMTSGGNYEPPRPGYCANPVSPTTRRPVRGHSGAHARCDADLRHIDTPRPPEGHAAVHAQRLLNEMFATDRADFGVYILGFVDGTNQPR